MLARTLALSLAAALATLPAVGPAQAQVEEVLCPIFIPEAPVKYCILLKGNGCVVVHVSTLGTSRKVETCLP